MRIFESQGVRTYKRSLQTIEAALKIHHAFVQANAQWSSLADLAYVAELHYNVAERTLPFECEGLVYSLTSDDEGAPYRKGKRVIIKPGRLEDYSSPMPDKISPQERRLSAIEARLTKLEQERAS